MKKIIIPIICCVLSFSILLTGCGSSGYEFYKSVGSAVTYSAYTDIKAGLDGASFVTNGSGKVEVSENGNVVVSKVIEGKTCYGVYNVNEGVYKYNLEEATSISIFTYEGVGDVFEIDKTGGSEVKYLKANGEILLDKVQGATFLGYRAVKKVTYEAWSYKVDGLESFVVYQTKKGVRKEYFSIKNGVGHQLGETTFIWGGYLSESLVDYVIESAELASGNLLYKVQNKKGKVVGEYEIDSQHLNTFAMVGEYIYFQYEYPVDSYSSDFDFIDGGEKYNLVTERVTVKNGKTKEIKNFGYYLVSNGVPRDGFSRVRVQKISNKLLGEVLPAFITENGKIIEQKYEYAGVIKISEDLLIAEDYEDGYAKDYNLLHIIDKEGNIKVDLSNSEKNYNYASHSDNVVIIEDTTDSEKTRYAMIDHKGILLTKFDYDTNYGVVNGTWLAGKILDATSGDDVIRTYAVYAVNAKGEETLISQKKIKVDGEELVSNKFGDKDIVEFTTYDGVVACVRENGSEAGKYNYNFYSFDNFTTPIMTFSNAEPTQIEIYAYGLEDSSFLVTFGDSIGVLK